MSLHQEPHSQRLGTALFLARNGEKQQNGILLKEGERECGRMC